MSSGVLRQTWYGTDVKGLHIVILIPAGEPPQSLPDADLRPESKIFFQGPAVCIGDRDIARLHTHKLSVPFEIIVLWKGTGIYKFFLKSAYIVQKVFWGALQVRRL